MSVARRVALVTGGSRGIGLAIAKALARDGCYLAINGTRPADAVQDVLESLRNRGIEAEYFQGDIADVDQRNALVQGVLEAFGHVNVLVNNAGRAPRERVDILQAGQSSFDSILATNLTGPYFLTQQVARHMVERLQTREAQDDIAVTRSPCIVFVTSVSAEVASVQRGEYCVSKAGLSMAARLWAVRLAEYGIRVYEVRPGVIRTDMTAPVAERYDRLIAEGLTLERRWGTPEDVGAAVAALVRGDIPYATGSIITVDGGWTVPRL